MNILEGKILKIMQLLFDLLDLQMIGNGENF